MSLECLKKLRILDIFPVPPCLVFQTHCQRMSHLAQSRSDEISDWFNSYDIDGESPYSYVERVVNEFCNIIEKRGYMTDISRQKLMYDMCSATCTMYYYEHYLHRRFIIGAPKKKFTKPLRWSAVLEAQWNDYVHSRIVNYEFWERFWKELPAAYWESTLTHDSWRDVIQYLLPFYIRREIDILLDEEIVCQEENGNIVTWDDHEVEEEPDIRDMDGSKKKKGK